MYSLVFLCWDLKTLDLISLQCKDDSNATFVFLCLFYCLVYVIGVWMSFFPVQNKSCILLLKKNSWVEVFGYYDLVGENNYSSLLFWSCFVRTFSSFWHLQYSCSPSNHLVLLAEHRLILDCTTVVSAYFFLLKV